MKKILIILVFSISNTFIYAQTKEEKLFLTNVLSSNKVEITKNNINKSLTDPTHWFLMATYTNKVLEPAAIFTSFKFLKNGIFLMASPLTAKASEVEEGMWKYDSQTKILKLIRRNNENIFKVYILNAAEIMVEEMGKTRYFFAAQTDFTLAPKAMQWKVQFTNLLGTSELKEKWQKQ